MNDMTGGRAHAVDLARAALVALDAIGDATPAIHIQHAIDIMVDAPRPSTIAEMELFLAAPETQALLDRSRSKPTLPPTLPVSG